MREELYAHEKSNPKLSGFSPIRSLTGRNSGYKKDEYAFEVV
jgi:hypothetical protein